MGKTAYKSIVITGASAGLGRALAEAWAAEGVVLGLIGRDEGRLQAVAEACRTRGAVVELGPLDVADGAALSDWVARFHAAHSLDLMIANAGITAAAGQGDALLEPRSVAQRLIDTNFIGVVNAVYAAVPLFQAQGRGQVALVSSLAAWRGMALTPLYSGTKAAIKVYGEALRDLLAPVGIGVSVICPGFVETAMSDRFPGPRPLMISAPRAAALIQRGVETNQAHIAFPWSFTVGLKLLSVLPYGVGSFFLRGLNLQPPPFPKQ